MGLDDRNITYVYSKIHIFRINLLLAAVRLYYRASIRIHVELVNYVNASRFNMSEILIDLHYLLIKIREQLYN